MADSDPSGPRSTNWRRLLKLAVAITLGALLLVAGRDLTRSGWSYLRTSLPMPVGAYLDRTRSLWLTIFLAISLHFWTHRRSRRDPETARRLDQAAGFLLRRGMPLLVGTASLAMFLCWLPHSLLWPWWADVEHFALSALSWEAGVSPYRDLYDFNFPGPMYVHWVLGKVFGWGRTTPFYVVDALQLVVFAAVAVCWSRIRFGGSLPGWISVALAASYYFSLPYHLASQRDWRVPLFASAGMMMLQGWPGRPSRWLAAVLFGVAFAFRPHVVVFGPAFLFALDENARPSGGSIRNSVRAVLEWSLVAAVVGVVMFLPLVLTGTLDDFVANFREALHGGGYDAAGRRSFIGDLVRQLDSRETIGGLLGLVVAAILAEPVVRRSARPWLAALVGVLFYLPLSPVAHGYLGHPLKFVWCVAVGVTAAALVVSARLGAVVKLVGILGLLTQLIPGIPLNCRPSRTLESLGYLWRGVTPEFPPPGCEREFSRASSHFYQWDHYQQLLGYLRSNTRLETPVANVFRNYPYPTLNAPTGRLSPFPSVAGILWLRWVDSSLEAEFARTLDRPGDGVVVWIPEEPPGHDRLKLPIIVATIRRDYALETRIGKLEIWRRRGDAPTDIGETPRDVPDGENP